MHPWPALVVSLRGVPRDRRRGFRAIRVGAVRPVASRGAASLVGEIGRSPAWVGSAR